LDGSRRRLVVQDATAAVEVLLPSPASVRVGERLRLVGTVGTAYGAPRLRASEVSRLGSAEPPAPEALTGGPEVALEWRLVRLDGTVDRVTRTGATWRADVLVQGDRVLVLGMPGAGVPPARMVVRSCVTVTGIVRRPYPSATDRRFAVLPRAPGDVLVAGAAGAGARNGAATTGPTRGASRPAADDEASVAGQLVDLARLSELVGRRVRVAGLLVERTADELWLDDGTSRGGLVLIGEARDAQPLAIGDAIEAEGEVAADTDGPHLVVDAPDAILVVSSAPAGASTVASATGGVSAPTGRASSATTGPGASDGAPPILALALLVAVSLALAAAGAVLRARLAALAAARRIGRRLAAIPASAPSPGPVPLADEARHARSSTLHAS
ncbi:MAG TPA: hypothetical protein VEY67_04920, partial [Candidatus Dormibacteraeota bacterium]|nr:hypothetical protein [Candidatus Dormibacteraeota bacterium]